MFKITFNTQLIGCIVQLERETEKKRGRGPRRAKKEEMRQSPRKHFIFLL